IVIYAMMIIVTFSGANHPFNSRGSLIGLLVVSAFIAYLSGHSLSRGIRSAVDRLYYGDWYDFRAAVQQLSQQLAGSVAEKDVITILTEKVPDILHIEKAILVIRDKDDLWFLPPQRNTPAAMDFMKALDSLNDLPELSGSQTRPAIGMRGHPLMVWGVAAILPLAHSGRMMGCLLLGRKDSQSPYSNRDFELLSTLSSFAGMAIYNLELQSTIIERESRARAADLAAGVAHEINNALYPLKGQAQLMLHSLSQASLPLPRESLYASAQTMLESAETIQRIANTLNHLSKPIIPNKERLILSDIADEAIRILRDTAGRIKRFQADRPDSPYRIVRDYAEQLPAIEADRAQLIQVFINLIINAADAMESRAEGVLTVGARLSETRDQVVGFVADSGSGIRPELLKKIVQPYFTTKANNQGTGLGLAIVHSIIANHSGSLVISSVVDHGTRVEFALPLPTPSLPRIN
ncbi:MAG: ATP-binding protein, partial [Calditrichota bacterium]